MCCEPGLCRGMEEEEEEQEEEEEEGTPLSPPRAPRLSPPSRSDAPR